MDDPVEATDDSDLNSHEFIENEYEDVYVDDAVLGRLQHYRCTIQFYVRQHLMGSAG